MPKAKKPERWIALVGLEKGHQRAEPGEVVPFEVPRWVIEQGHVRRAKPQEA